MFPSGRFWFYKKGYPKGLVEREMGKVKLSGYTRTNKREKKGIPYVITNHLSLKNIGRIINQNLYSVYVKVYLHWLQWFLFVVQES